MLNKVRLALVAPEALIEYRRDSLFKVFSYLLFFALLMSTASLIMVINFQGVDTVTETVITEGIVTQETSCEIEDSLLDCDQDLTLLEVTNFSVITKTNSDYSDLTGFTYYFVLHEDRLDMVFFGQVFESRLISELDESMHNLSLNTETNEEEVSRALIDTLNHELVNFKAFWGPFVVLFNLLSALLLFNVFILINTFISRARLKEVPLKQMYVMMSYGATALYIVLIFEAMLGFNIFIFLVLLFIAFRQLSRLTLAIHQKVHKNNS
ncbi:MAG: hypothetical protein ACLFRI_01635 [Candidatus Izemoplasmataceae bacterium]